MRLLPFLRLALGTKFPVSSCRPTVMSQKPGMRSLEYAKDPRSLQNVVKNLKKFAPLKLAESWDNVGLLVEPSSEVVIERVLLTNDLTESVLEEAIGREVQLIVSYHPLIFPSFKAIRYTNWKERIVGTLLKKQIALYCPHTAWDSVEGGVNDWLACAFGSTSDNVEKVEPLKRYDSGKNLKIVNAVFANSDLASKATLDISNTPGCNIQSIKHNDGVWLRIQTDNEFVCLPYLRSATEVNISNHKTVSESNAGQGRRVALKEAISLQTAISLIKKHLNLPDVSVAVAHGGNFESSISSIAICAGSGGSVLKGVPANLYLTGEMSHHEVLDTVHNGTHVILTRHSNSERGFLEIAAKCHLKGLMPEIEFIISTKDKDPLVTG